MDHFGGKRSGERKRVVAKGFWGVVGGWECSLLSDVRV